MTITKSEKIIAITKVRESHVITYFVLLNKMIGNADKFVMSDRARRRDRTTIFSAEPGSVGPKSNMYGSSISFNDVGGSR
jgi:hypothetical protein